MIFNGYLFAYMEYVGRDIEKDMAKMAADPKTQEWWADMEECFWGLRQQ